MGQHEFPLGVPVSHQSPCRDLLCASISHPIHHHMTCLCPKALFSFSIEVNAEMCASSKPSGPQENTGKFLVAILQDTPNSPLSWGTTAGRWVRQGCRADNAHPEPSPDGAEGVVWLVRASHAQCAATAKGVERCSPGADRRFPGEEQERTGRVPFCCDLTLKRSPLKRIL